MRFPNVSHIKLLRTNLGMTQSGLSKRSGVSQSTIAKIERGTVKGSYAEIVRIFNVLNEEAKKRKTITKLKDISTKSVVSIQTEEKVRRASEIMRENGISQLPVFEGSQPVGSISERSILNLIMSGVSMEEAGRRPVRTIMDDPFPVVSEDVDKEAVEALILSEHAVLTTKSGKITGIVTSADLIRFE